MKAEELDRAIAEVEAARAATPDPDLEPVPARRRELKERRRVLDGERRLLGSARGVLKNLDGKLRPLRAQRAALAAAVAGLERQVAETEAALEAARRDRPGAKRYPEEFVVAKLRAAVEAGRDGWIKPGFRLPAMPDRQLVEAVEAVDSTFDWAAAKPLRVLDGMVADLEGRRAVALKRVSRGPVAVAVA